MAVLSPPLHVKAWLPAPDLEGLPWKWVQCGQGPSPAGLEWVHGLGEELGDVLLILPPPVSAQVRLQGPLAWRSLRTGLSLPGGLPRTALQGPRCCPGGPVTLGQAPCLLTPDCPTRTGTDWERGWGMFGSGALAVCMRVRVCVCLRARVSAYTSILGTRQVVGLALCLCTPSLTPPPASP